MLAGASKKSEYFSYVKPLPSLNNRNQWAGFLFASLSSGYIVFSK